MKTVATQVSILAVAGLMLFGVHKYDEGTQERITQGAHVTATLTWKLCDARNHTLTKSNERWAHIRDFLLQAAAVRAEQAKSDPPDLAALDREYATKWANDAHAIQPFPTVDCGAHP